MHCLTYSGDDCTVCNVNYKLGASNKCVARIEFCKDYATEMTCTTC